MVVALRSPRNSGFFFQTSLLRLGIRASIFARENWPEKRYHDAVVSLTTVLTSGH